MNSKRRNQNLISRFFSALGPGLITGAADDDPSGIATYSIAGAKLGIALLWTAFFIWPLMAAVQMMCARVGMVTGMGLVRALRQKFPKPLIIAFSVSLLLANTINIGADLLGMSDAGQLLTGAPVWLLVPVFGIGITLASVKCRYQQIARILKWLCLALFAYVITGFIVHPDWKAVIAATFVPSLPHGRKTLEVLVAILGTTISPYLFVWQASQEVEEQKASGKNHVHSREGATRQEIRARGLDVIVGSFFSNFVMYFVILTTGLVLHPHGITDIETSAQAAQALRPLAGQLAELFYTVGIVGVGLLSIPTLAGSAAYAFAEAFKWKQGLDENLSAASRFYGIFILAMVAGMALYFCRVNPVKALYWSAIINGLLAPVMLLGIVWVASNRRIMRQQPASWIARAFVLLTALLMTVAAVGMFL